MENLILNRKYIFKGSISIAMLDYRRVDLSSWDEVLDHLVDRIPRS